MLTAVGICTVTLRAGLLSVLAACGAARRRRTGRRQFPTRRSRWLYGIDPGDDVDCAFGSRRPGNLVCGFTRDGRERTAEITIDEVPITADADLPVGDPAFWQGVVTDMERQAQAISDPRVTRLRRRNPGTAAAAGPRGRCLRPLPGRSPAGGHVHRQRRRTLRVLRSRDAHRRLRPRRTRRSPVRPPASIARLSHDADTMIALAGRRNLAARRDPLGLTRSRRGTRRRPRGSGHRATSVGKRRGARPFRARIGATVTLWGPCCPGSTARRSGCDPRTREADTCAGPGPARA